ncbi:DNA topoisomerase VI, partial [Nanoarchaeota archaeon]
MKKVVLKKLEDLGKEVVEKLEKGENPYIEIPVRGLSNVIYDEKRRRIILGDKVLKRYFFNVAHAKKFMQTFLVAAFCKNLLEENI